MHTEPVTLPGAWHSRATCLGRNHHATRRLSWPIPVWRTADPNKPGRPGWNSVSSQAHALDFGGGSLKDAAAKAASQLAAHTGALAAGRFYKRSPPGPDPLPPRQEAVLRTPPGAVAGPAASSWGCLAQVPAVAPNPTGIPARPACGTCPERDTRSQVGHAPGLLSTPSWPGTQATWSRDSLVSRREQRRAGQPLAL